MPVSQAKNTLIQYGNAATPELFANIGYVLSIGGPSATLEVVDVTDLDSAAVDRIASGVYDGGEVQIDIHFEADNTVHDAMFDRIIACSTGNYQICWPNVTANSRAVSAVDDAVNDTLEFLAAHGLKTGQPVQVGTDTTLPAPLAAETTYYAIYFNATKIQLATTNALAVAGTEINLTDGGAGTHTLYYGTRADFAAILTNTAPSAAVKDRLAANMTYTIDGTLSIA